MKSWVSERQQNSWRSWARHNDEMAALRSEMLAWRNLYYAERYQPRFVYLGQSRWKCEQLGVTVQQHRHGVVTWSDGDTTDTGTVEGLNRFLEDRSRRFTAAAQNTKVTP